MKFKKGDLVFCLGEGEDFFKIEEINERAAWLTHYFSGTPAGWENIEKLSPIPKEKIQQQILKIKNRAGKLPDLEKRIT